MAAGGVVMTSLDPVDLRPFGYQVSHVLEWVPQFLNGNGARLGDCHWDLWTLADWEAGFPRESKCESYRGFSDASPDDLAPWVAEKVGYPVVLVGSEMETRRKYFFWTRFHTVPIYYVARAGQAVT